MCLKILYSMTFFFPKLTSELHIIMTGELRNFNGNLRLRGTQALNYSRATLNMMYVLQYQ